MLFSIVMPVYNGGKVITDSLKSILEQEYTEWELIVVDDGSTDNSAYICDECAKKNQKVMVVHTPNNGPAQARNIGLEKAQGEYVLFVDAGDYIEKMTLKHIKKVIDKQNPDLIIYNYFNENEEEKNARKIEEMFCRSNEEFKEIFQELDSKFMTYPVWNKAYRRECIEKTQAKFPIGINVAEDFVFNTYIYREVQTVLVINQPLYHYVYRKGESISQKFDLKKIEYAIQVYDKVSEFYEQWLPHMKNNAKNMLIYDVSVYINNMFNKGVILSRKERKKLVDNILNKEQIQECINHVQCNGNRNKIVVFLLKHKMKKSLLLIGRISRIGK